MKSLLVSAVFLFALVTGLHAQTNAQAPAELVKAETAKVAEPYPVTAIVVSNTITFPILLSAKSEPLMTNALYHRTFGRKVIFEADLQLKSFDIDKLHPSVIAQLDLDTNKAKADQDALDKKNQDWAAQRQAQNQQLLSAEAAALAKSQAAAEASQASSTNGAGTPSANGKPHHTKKPTTPPPAN
jgi:hypothetical protein